MDIGSLVVTGAWRSGHAHLPRSDLCIVSNGGEMGRTLVRKAMDDHPLTCTTETDMDEVRRMMLDRHARYMPVMNQKMLMGVISFYDVAKAVVDSQNFENKMLKAYIRDWPPKTKPKKADGRRLRDNPAMSGNTFGKLFAVTNFGESHGPAIGCVIDGCPPGMALSEADIQGDLDRRRPGTSKYVTQRNEPDAVEILSGVYEGKTTGTPICLLIKNTDQRSKDYGNIVRSSAGAPTTPISKIRHS
jgi:hypothetical protein